MDAQKKLRSKEILAASIEETLKVFEVYKSTQTKEVLQALAAQKEPVKVEKPLESANKVVECSILTEKEQVQTATKETQSIQAPVAVT